MEENAVVVASNGGQWWLIIGSDRVAGPFESLVEAHRARSEWVDAE